MTYNYDKKTSAFSGLKKLIFFKGRFVKYWFSADRNLNILLLLICL